MQQRNCESGASERKRRVERDRLAEEILADRQVCRPHVGPMVLVVVDRAEIQIVGFETLRRLARELQRLRSGQLRMQRVGNFLSYRGFDREHVGEVAVVGLGPELSVAACV